MSEKITSFERDILRSLNGEKVEGLAWGAAMGAAVEYLQAMGYVTRWPNVQITDEGRKALEQ